MRTEDQLHRAAAEMERTTASLTAPPIAEVRRSARRRGIGVAIAAAVGAAMLVGGGVMAFSPRGETTLGPASPGETTSTMVTTTTDAVPTEVYGIPVRVPEPDAAPNSYVPDDAVEVEFVVPPNVVGDLMQAVTSISSVSRDQAEEVVVLGDLHGYQAFAVRGELVRVNPEDGSPDAYSWCLVILRPDYSVQYSCYVEEARAEGLLTTVRDEDGVFGVAGLAPEGATGAILELDGATWWAETRGGYINLLAKGSPDSGGRYWFYDANGDELTSGTIRVVSVEETSAAETTAAAVEVDVSCSGATAPYPSSYPRDDLSEPATQTAYRIMLFGSRCWFDDLEAVAGDDFLASYGGDDPSELWAYEEENGYEPMLWLLSILDTPHGAIETENGTLYVWPAAHAHQGDWDTMPEADLEVLRTLFTEDEMQAFADFGSYIGYRVGIWEDGTWSFFVAGD